MRPESRLEIAERRVLELEGMVARQKERIKRDYALGFPIHESALLLSFFENTLENAKDALVTIAFRQNPSRNKFDPN